LLNADSIPAPRFLPLEGTPEESAIDDIEGQFNAESMAGNFTPLIFPSTYIELRTKSIYLKFGTMYIFLFAGGFCLPLQSLRNKAGRNFFDWVLL